MNPNMLSLIRAVPALGALLLAVPTGAAFIDNLNGTVTDDQTGLMWDKCSWADPLLDPNTCLGTPTTDEYQWPEALAVALTANTINHRGYNDWRLPSKNELESLVDRSRSSPAIDPTPFPNTPSVVYWTSTTYAPMTFDAWSVIFNHGNVVEYNKYLSFRVRLVRSGRSFDPYDLLESEDLIIITATANPLAGGTVTCDPNPVPSGENSACTATPNSGYRFSRWEGDCTGGGACVLSDVTAPKSVIARFTKSNPPTSAPALGPWGLSLLAGLLAGIGGFQRWWRRRVHR